MEIIKTINFKINENGNCKECDCLIEHEYHNYCKAFDTGMNQYGDNGRLEECVNYIAKEKEKVYCNSCVNENQFYHSHDTGVGCQKGNVTEEDLNGWFCRNCKDKEC